LYYNILMYESWHVFLDYVKLINEYVAVYKKTAKSIKTNKSYKNSYYLLLNGYNALTHIFKMVLHKNCNTKLSLEMMRCSIYYYTQFIEQMEENLMYDLNVSSNSASIFIYKKATEETDKYPKENDLGRDFYINIDKLTDIYKSLFELVDFNELNELSVKELNMKEISNTVVELSTNITSEIELNIILDSVILFMSHNKEYEYIKIYIKKYKHYPLTIPLLWEKKMKKEYESLFHADDADKYIKWLLCIN